MDLTGLPIALVTVRVLLLFFPLPTLGMSTIQSRVITFFSLPRMPKTTSIPARGYFL
uniref:Uncharacterized protein n=1 Tax=Physcomitrium patens TaxID=3218 RepID=A0A2K1KWQ6_PHYPA|nr:hypothetical protein PHYPA_005175 [Physcomitrium patens]